MLLNKVEFQSRINPSIEVYSHTAIDSCNSRDLQYHCGGGWGGVFSWLITPFAVMPFNYRDKLLCALLLTLAISIDHWGFSSLIFMKNKEFVRWFSATDVHNIKHLPRIINMTFLEHKKCLFDFKLALILQFRIFSFIWDPLL